MGTDVYAILGHRLSGTEELNTLSSRLNEFSRQRRLADSYLKYSGFSPSTIGIDPWVLEDEQGADSASALLTGFADCSLYVHRHSLILTTGIRWPQFIRDPLTQLRLQNLASSLAEFFQSDCSVYLPDDIWKPGLDALDRVHEGATLQEMLSLLGAAGGPFHQIDDGGFVDDFGDLPLRTHMADLLFKVRLSTQAMTSLPRMQSLLSGEQQTNATTILCNLQRDVEEAGGRVSALLTPTQSGNLHALRHALRQGADTDSGWYAAHGAARQLQNSFGWFLEV